MTGQGHGFEENLDIYGDLSDTPNFSGVAQLVGLDKAAKISLADHGRSLFIPKNARLGHRLADLIGLSALQRLMSVYGGMNYEVPTIPAQCAKIIIGLRQKTSHCQLANETFTSRRKVIRLKNEIARHGGAMIGDFFYPIEIDGPNAAFSECELYLNNRYARGKTGT